MEQMPASPVTELGESAVVMHELFMSYVEVGFTRDEALRLVIAMVKAGFQESSDEQES